MDHFNITQECVHCLRGAKLFRVDLSCYDDDGRLIVQLNDMERFRLMCPFCWRKTTLDFYRFSHPDLICYLKRLHKQYEETKKALDILYILFNNIKK